MGAVQACLQRTILKLKRLSKLFWLLAVTFAAFAAPAQVTVNATLTDGTGTVYRTAYLHFQLQNCGANFPVTTGTTAIIQDSFDLRPPSPGSSISATVIGNDQILCGNVKSTYYQITPMKDSTHPIRDGALYVVCSASSTLTTCGNATTLGTFNLVTALPMTQNPPSPGLVELYGNPTNTQTLNEPFGSKMNFVGTMDFCSATVLCGGGGGGGGSVTNIATTLPITGGSITTTGTIGVNPATGSATGVVQLAGDLSGAATAPTVTNGAHINNSSIANNGLVNNFVTVTGTSPLAGGGSVTLGQSTAITCPNCVTAVGGGAIPTSKPVLGSNSNGLPVAANYHGISTPLNCPDSSGSPTTQACATVPATPPSAGDCIIYSTTTQNTGALTINVNGSGNETVVKWLGTALGPGDMPVNRDVLLCGDGTSWDAMTIGNAPITLSAGAPQVGDILRYNINGDSAWDPANYSQAFVGIYTENQVSNLITTGILGNGGAVVTGSQGNVNPTSTLQAGDLVSAAASASTSTVIGMHFAENGTGSLLGMTAFYRWTLKASMGGITNVRYWFGLGCVTSNSPTGNNGLGISNPGTVAYATDSPNKSTIGFRYSAGTDTHWQAVTDTAAGSQTVVDTGITPDTAIHLFEMTTNAAGSAINYFIDGVLVATISTNIPPPANAQNSWGDLFFTGDNKNTNNAISLTFYSMQMSVKL